MNRYLLNVSYIGTRFKSFSRIGKISDTSSVQGAIDLALDQLKSISRSDLKSSSRTDARVHAISSSMCVDLHRKNGQPYDANHMKITINKFLSKNSLDCLVNNVELVADDFDVRRNALSRSYMYRLAVIRSHDLKHRIRIPIEETHRCYFRYTTQFDIEKAKAVAPLLIGKHDFRSFMGASTERKALAPSFAIRKINDIRIERGYPLTVTNDEYPGIEYWNIHVNARSFVYRQIRRIVGILMGVGEGRLNEKNVYEMLTIPSKYSWPAAGIVAKAHGLYLTNVVYSEESKRKK